MPRRLPANPMLLAAACVLTLVGAIGAVWADAKDEAPKPSSGGALTDDRGPRDERDDRGRFEGRGDDDDRRRGDWRPEPVELTDERIEKYMTVIRSHFPDFAERLQTLRDEDPEQFQRTLRRMGHRVERMVEDMERDPVGFELRARRARLNGQIFAAARKLREATSEDAKSQARAELRELVDQEFTLRLEDAEHDVSQLEKRIDQLRAEIAERRANRDARINERVDEIAAMAQRFGEREGDRDRRGPDFDGRPTPPGRPGAPGGPREFDRPDRPDGPAPSPPTPPADAPRRD